MADTEYAQNDIQVPFKFFFDLYKEQKKVVDMLETKTIEAEKLTMSLYEQ